MPRRAPSSRARRPQELRVPGADGLPTSEHVFRQLQRLIIEGELVPGARLVEHVLAEEFGVSRTPVREALKRLVSADLVLADPMRGLVVRIPEAAEIDEMYVVREVLDGLAARLATERMRPNDLARLRLINDSMREAIRKGRTDVIVNANIAFHDQIYEAAGNRTLARYGLELRNFVRRFSGAAFASPSRVNGVLRDHERLLKAMERRDAGAAERASTEHLHKARAHIADLHVRGSVGVAAEAASGR